MFTNNFKLFWRHLWKHASISLVNIIGLSVSLAIGALIVLFIQFEYSFDKSNPSQAEIYRLLTTFKYPNSPETQTAMASPLMGPYLERESSDIDNHLRVMSGDENFLCKADGQETVIGKSLQVDSTFFSFFDFQLRYGNTDNAFNHLNNILLSNQVSEDLFGQTNPVGKILDYTYPNGDSGDTTVHYIVSAVFEDLPQNSHLQFDALTKLDDRVFEQQAPGNRWHGVSTNTYFQCRPGIDVAEVEASFPKYLEKEMPGHDMIALHLQPLSDIHFGSMALAYDNNNFQKSDWKYVKILGLVALFILLISGINFANLSSVLAMRRVQEIGVRKSLGASDGNMFGQFLGEAVFMSLLAGCLALFWLELLREPFLSLLGREVDLSISILWLSGFVVAMVLLGMLAGMFPALQSARFSAVTAFQRKDTSVSIRRPFIKRLVVAQFTLASTLITGVVISHSQLDFMQNKDLGFQYDQIVELNIGNSNWMHANAVRNELSTLPGIIDISGSDMSLGGVDGQNGVLVENEETREMENFPMSINRVSHNYFSLYAMEFVDGGQPSGEASENDKAFVVNETFLKKVGWQNDPIGRRIARAVPGMTEDDFGRVVGVIKDIHHNTLHNAIEPICFQVSDFTPILSAKVQAADMQAFLAQTQLVWNNHIKDRPFTYQFMDDHFAQLYQNEQRLGSLLMAATGLAIFIACLGLLALSAFIIQQRTKEIGIRKVLGASTAGIIGLLSQDFLKLVFVALLIAVPIAYYFMEKWLQDFAYRVDIRWTMFLIAGAVTLASAFFTVSFQSARAALANPINSLRSE